MTGGAQHDGGDGMAGVRVAWQGAHCMASGFPLGHSARQSRNPATPGLNRSAVVFWMLRLRAA